MDYKEARSEPISSVKNPKVKNFRLLQKSRERKKQGLFIVEGKKELERAIAAGYSFDHVFICEEYYEGSIDLKSFSDKIAKVEKVTSHVYAHIAYRNDSEGIIGWCISGNHEIGGLKLSPNPLVIVLESVEKPGNLGAILRTAEAAGIDAVIVCDPLTDIYNPNVVRSSIGGLFSVQCGIGTSSEVIKWLKNNQIPIYCTSLNASRPYFEVDFTKSSAIIMGTESTGLSNEWLKESDQNIIIPMKGSVDSMNVSVSTGIILFEALRQRGKIKQS